MPVNANLLAEEICNFQTTGIGIARTKISVKTSVTAKLSSNALVFVQCSMIVVTLVHQFAAFDPHINANAKRNDSDHRTIATHMKSE